MFGEDASESPRVPSPWANIISASPSPAHGPVAKGPFIPRLVPEAEDGNVEYKLQLLNPSPARFARLVTQLKWRLLEGGGQAYYELGVADSGALIGLPRAELEMTLETLEMMAGEIGASVIVVKEIEVPAIMAELCMVEESAGIASNGAAGFDKREWVGSRRTRRRMTGYEDGSTTETDFDSSFEPMSTDTDTDEAVASCSRSSSSESLIEEAITIDLEISSVYKPRPVRYRPNAHLPSSGKRKVKRYLLPGLQENASGVPNSVPSNDPVPESDGKIQTKPSAKAAFRRLARDRRREEKRKALLDRAQNAEQDIKPKVATKESYPTSCEQRSQRRDHDAEELTSSMATLHACLLDRAEDAEEIKSKVAEEQVGSATCEPQFQCQDHDVEDLTSSLATLHASVCVAPVPTIDLDVTPTAAAFLSDASDTATVVTVETKATPRGGMEPRLIVEALVVRKLSIEEAFLDFGGFSLVG